MSLTRKEIDEFGKKIHALERADLMSIKPLAMDALCSAYNAMLRIADDLEALHGKPR